VGGEIRITIRITSCGFGAKEEGRMQNEEGGVVEPEEVIRVRSHGVGYLLELLPGKTREGSFEGV
jgi:hypothetical protein